VVSFTHLAQQQTILPINTQANYYKWLVAAIVLIAEGTNTFAGNSINLAVPRLMAHFGTDVAETQRVSTRTPFRFLKTPACSHGIHRCVQLWPGLQVRDQGDGIVVMQLALAHLDDMGLAYRRRATSTTVWWVISS
jgi:hypothetical protein